MFSKKEKITIFGILAAIISLEMRWYKVELRRLKENIIKVENNIVESSNNISNRDEINNLIIHRNLLLEQEERTKLESEELERSYKEIKTLKDNLGEEEKSKRGIFFRKGKAIVDDTKIIWDIIDSAENFTDEEIQQWCSRLGNNFILGEGDAIKLGTGRFANYKELIRNLIAESPKPEKWDREEAIKSIFSGTLRMLKSDIDSINKAIEVYSESIIIINKAYSLSQKYPEMKRRFREEEVNVNELLKITQKLIEELDYAKDYVDSTINDIKNKMRRKKIEIIK